MNDIKYVIDEIKNKADIVSIISDYINVKQSGNNFIANCPFHNEKTPSFHISNQKQIYKCFGCGEGGDVISFIMKMENIEFFDAVKFLANKCAIEFNSQIDNKQKEKIEKTKKYTDIHTEAARFYFSNLLNTKNEAYTYLLKRGLDIKTIKRFGLGYSLNSWDSLKKYLLNKGFEKKDLVECGIFSFKDSRDNFFDKFRNRVMFPIFDYRGNVIAFGGRVLDDALPKYLNSPESLIFSKSNNLYGLNFAKKYMNERVCILVEGYMDLISINQYGIKNVLATLGTSLTKNQALLIKRYADKVIISYDNDKAGITASLRAIEILIKENLNVYVLDLKDSKDPDEFLRKYGVDEYKKQVEGASHYIKYKIDLLSKKYNLKNIEEDKEFVKDAIKIIKTLKNNVDKDYYSKYLSSISSTDFDTIKREIYPDYYKSKINYNNFKKTEKINIEKVSIQKEKTTVEKTLIKILIENKELANEIALKVNINDFLLENSKEILKYIIKNENLDKITIDKLKSLNISEEYIKDIEDIHLNAINLKDVKYINEIIKNTKKNTLYEKIQVLRNEQDKFNKLQKSDEVEKKLMQIGIEIINLTKEIKGL